MANEFSGAASNIEKRSRCWTSISNLQDVFVSLLNDIHLGVAKAVSFGPPIFSVRFKVIKRFLLLFCGHGRLSILGVEMVIVICVYKFNCTA